MAHAIEVTLSANVEKFNQGMAAAKKTGSDTVGFIASIFATVTSYFGKMWDSVKSFFSNVSDKGGSAWNSFSSSATGAFQKVMSMLPGVGSAAKDAGDGMEDAEKKSDGLISKIGTGLVVAATAAAAAITALTAKGLLIDSAFAKASVAGDIGASTLSKFDDIAKRSGMSVADLGTSMKTFEAAMKEAAAGTGGAVFDQLHVSVKNSNDELLATAPTLIDFAKHVAAMSSEAEKYGAAAKSGFSVQALEDIAHAGALTASTTDDQAAAMVRLQKVWHEVLPGGKSMWDDISTSLSAKLTPALTEASVSILESKNKIVDAFGQIFSGGSMFDKLTDKIAGWANSLAGYFADVVKKSTDAAISLGAYIAKATGLGGDIKTAPSAGYVPGATPLASGATVTVPDAAMQKQIDDYKAASLAIKAKNDATKEEIATGKSLTDARSQQIALAAGVRDGTIKMTMAQYTNRMEELASSDALQKAAIASKAAQTAAEAAAKKEVEQYASVSAAIASKIAENQLELLTGTAVTEGQKLAIKLDADQASGKKALTAEHLAAAKAALVELDAVEKQVLEGKAQKDVNKYIDEGVTARTASRNALEAEYQAYGKSSDALGMLMVVVNSETEMQKQLDKMRAANLPISAETIKRLEDEADARTKAGQATLGQSNALKYATQLQDANKLYAAQSISDPQASAAAVLKIDTDLWQRRIKLAGDGTEAQKTLQTEYNTWLAHATKDSIAGASLEQARQLLDIMNAVDDSAQSAAQGMVNSFGQVGQAIGGLTTALSGYGRTQAAIAAQLAQSTKDAGGDTSKISRANALAAQQSAQAQIHSYGDMAGAAKGFFKENSTGYKVMEGAEKAFRAVEMVMAIQNMVAKSGLVEAFTGLFVTSKATETAATVASVAPDVAASVAKGTASAAAGVANQAQGDPYSAFGRMAAMAAIMAALGFAVSGGSGSDTTAKDRQAANGTGSVLGDSTAKSDSISHAIALTATNSVTLINYTAAMVTALNSIEANIGSFASQVLQTSNVTSALPADTKGTASSIVSSAAFNIAAGGALGILAVSIDKLLGGKLGNFVGKVANAIFGGNTTALDTGITANKTSLGSAVSSGVQSSQYVDTKTDGGWFHSDSYNTQLASLGAAANDQFTLIIKSMADSVTEAGKLLGIGGDAFTQHLSAFVIDIGKISTKDLTGDQIQAALETAFSKVGDDMASWAVAGLGQFQKVGEGSLETLVRVATDYAKLDASLVSVGLTFGQTGVASIGARESLIALLGGIDNFQSTVADYGKNFLTQAQQIAPVAKYVNDQLASMGLSWIKTRADFKTEIDSLSGNLADAGTQQLYASLMSLESAFATVTPAIEDTTKSLQDIADERKDMVSQFDQLTLTSTQLRAKERLSIDASNLALFDQITYLQTIADTSDTLKTSISNLKAFRDGILSFKDSLTLGSLSTLTPLQKAAEAKNQYDAILAKAEGGDTTAQAGVQAAATAFLTASQVVNASSSAYVADAARVQADMATLAAIAGTQMDESQQQLDYLNQQVTQLAALNATASGIATALTTSDWSAVGTSDMSPLVDEIKGLRDDNASLKADNAALLTAINNQTAAVVRATLAAAASNAAAVTAGAQDTAAAQAWQQQLLAEVAAK